VISVAASRFHHLTSLGRTQDVAWTNGFQWAFWISLAFCAVGFLATVAVIRRVTLPDLESAALPQASKSAAASATD
jgi:hypothetical protein